MRRTTSAFAIGFTVAVCCILWITGRSHRKSADSGSNDASPPTESGPSSRPVSPATPSSPSGEGEHKPPIAPRKKDWIVAYLLIGISLCLIATWAYNLGINLVFVPSLPEGSERALTIPVVSDPSSYPGVSTLPTGYFPGSTSLTAHGLLMLNITQIKNETPTSATLSGTISLIVPSDLQKAICDSTKVSAVLNESQCPGRYSVTTQQSVCLFSLEHGQTQKTVYQLKQQYTSKNLTLIVDHVSNSPRNSLSNTPSFSVTLPLEQIFPSLPSSLFAPHGCGSADLVPDQVQVTIPMTVTIPLTGLGQAFPDDWYLGKAVVAVNLPPPLYIPEEFSKGGTAQLPYLPMDMRVTASTSMSNYTMRIMPGITATTEEGSKVALGPNLLLLSTTRSPLFWWFVYSTAFLVPLAFFLLFLHVLFLAKQEGGESLHITLLNVLTMVVTVAAIRQFLIPADLQGVVTRLDLWLGVWGMLLLTLFFVKYAWQLIRRE